jgi:hypothetical protein
MVFVASTTTCVAAAASDRRIEITTESVSVPFESGGASHSVTAVKGYASKLGLKSGKLFVLVHGANKQTQNAQFWSEHYSYFASHGVFYAVTLPGHGDAASTQASLSIHADAVAALLTHIKVRKREYLYRPIVYQAWAFRILT